MTSRKAVNDMDLFAKGWECPKCGAVMSPTTSCCVNCTGLYEVSIATNYTPATNVKGHTNDKGSFNFQKGE